MIKGQTYTLITPKINYNPSAFVQVHFIKKIWKIV